MNAPAEETAYLQARAHCANPSCTNAGLKNASGVCKLISSEVHAYERTGRQTRRNVRWQLPS
jgi:hypothetical protein